MIFVALTWCYAFLTTYILGKMAIRVFVKRDIGVAYTADEIIMCGIVVATVYAQAFSLCGAVGLYANIVLLLVCTAYVVMKRRELLGEITAVVCAKSKWWMYFSFPLLFVLWVYFTSRGFIHYDSDLYHAQSIRWIEEYGVVKGLGNLHERFAYNSSFFSLSALYSLKFVLGQSMHCMNGFFALILSVACLPLASLWKRRTFLLSDFARIAAIYYLTTIIDEVVSPASDFAVMCVVFYIVIKWLDLLEKKEKAPSPYAFLCVLCIYALTLKLTAGLLVLLVIKPAVELCKRRKWKEIGIYILCGIVVAIPWMLRTITISGWLLYPFAAIDLFAVDWKIPKVFVEVDAMQVKVWGRALYDIALIDVPIQQWFPNWFISTLTGTEKILIVGALACIVLSVVYLVFTLIRRDDLDTDILLVMGILVVAYCFWQVSAPLIRYGYANVLLLDSVVGGFFIIKLIEFCKGRKLGSMLYYLVLFMLCSYGVYKVIAMGKYVLDTTWQPFYVQQAPYGVYDLEQYQIGEDIYYYPKYGDRVGYESFPATPIVMELEYRGDGIKDGYRRP